MLIALANWSLYIMYWSMESTWMSRECIQGYFVDADGMRSETMLCRCQWFIEFVNRRQLVTVLDFDRCWNVLNISVTMLATKWICMEKGMDGWTILCQYWSLNEFKFESQQQWRKRCDTTILNDMRYLLRLYWVIGLNENECDEGWNEEWMSILWNARPLISLTLVLQEMLHWSLEYNCSERGCMIHLKIYLRSRQSWLPNGIILWNKEKFLHDKWVLLWVPRSQVSHWPYSWLISSMTATSTWVDVWMYLLCGTSCIIAYLQLAGTARILTEPRVRELTSVCTYGRK